VERSQHQNKITALSILKSKLYTQQELKKQQEKKDLYQEQSSINFGGHHIRSYVLQPYQICKDTRTGLEISNIHSVLDGGEGLTQFLDKALIHFNKLEKQEKEKEIQKKRKKLDKFQCRKEKHEMH